MKIDYKLLQLLALVFTMGTINAPTASADEVDEKSEKKAERKARQHKRALKHFDADGDGQLNNEEKIELKKNEKKNA